MCMGVLPLFVYVHHVDTWCQGGQKKPSDLLELELLCWELNLSSLVEQQVFLTAELSLQLQRNFLLLFLFFETEFLGATALAVLELYRQDFTIYPANLGTSYVDQIGIKGMHHCTRLEVNI